MSTACLKAVSVTQFEPFWGRVQGQEKKRDRDRALISVAGARLEVKEAPNTGQGSSGRYKLPEGCTSPIVGNCCGEAGSVCLWNGVPRCTDIVFRLARCLLPLFPDP